MAANTASMQLPTTSAGGVKQYDPPPALAWCQGKTNYVRLVTEINQAGKAVKKAICVRDKVIYMCEPTGTVLRSVKLDKITEIYEQDAEVKRTIVSKPVLERRILFKVPSEMDLLIGLTPDKANGPDGNNDPLLLETIMAVALQAGVSIKHEHLKTGNLHDEAVFTVPEGYVEPQQLLETKRQQLSEGGAKMSPSPPQAAPASAPAPASPTPQDGTVVALSARIRQLESEKAQLISAQSSQQSSSGSLQTEVADLRKQLATEKASREDMVRDLRADFDTQFIKKQAEEFELRQRQHQRLRDKDRARIVELEEQLKEPRTYNGDAAHLERIRNLEKKVAVLEEKVDVQECRAIHFENVTDEQYTELKRYWDFIQSGALPRIRDLQAGKDHKTLPLLPKLPTGPQPVPDFKYDAANKPVSRVQHADPAPAPSEGLADLSLGDIGGPAAAKSNPSADIDLDDLDLDLPAAPAKQEAISLDDDLDLL